MPSTSAKQAKFMRAVAHSPKFAKKVGVPQSVGKDFEMADKKKKMKKFGSGGWSGRGSVTVPLDEPKPAARRGSAPTAAEREEARRQNESLKKAKVTKQEGRVIESANRSEGGGHKKGGKVKKYADGGRVDTSAMMAKANRDIESMKANAARFAPKAGAKPAARRPQAGIPLRPKMPGRGAPDSYTINPVRPRGQAAPTQSQMQSQMGMDKAYADFQSQRNMGSQTPTQSQMQSQMGNAGQSAGSLTGATMKKGGKIMKKSDKAGRALVKKSADTMGRAMKMNKGGKCYAGGGLVAGHKSADGIARKGKTRGKMC